METVIYQSGCSEKPTKHPWVRLACSWLHVSVRHELRVGCSRAQPQTDEGGQPGPARDPWGEIASFIPQPLSPGWACCPHTSWGLAAADHP